jgi:tetratricopeptide (TPR) repeat protein
MPLVKKEERRPVWAATLLVLLCSVAAAPLTARANADTPTPRPAYLGKIVVHTEAEAQDVLRDLRAGTNFAIEAKEKSIDASARDGGYVGLEKAVQPDITLRGLTVGAFAGPVPVENGFAIYTVFASEPKTRDLDADAIKDAVKRGLVRDTIDISGMAEADAAFQVYAKPPRWSKDIGEICSARQDSYAAAVARIEQILPKADADPASQAVPRKLLQGHAMLAQLYIYNGEMKKSIDEWRKAYVLAQVKVPEATPYLEEALGVTYLHWAEMENGVYRSPGEKGLFPPAAGTTFAEQDNSRQAIDYFTKYLRRNSNSLEVKWLLNLAYMTVGGYPAKVPEAYLIPEKVFASKENIGRFRDVAPAAGLDIMVGAGGVVVDDFDNDGLLDVVVSSMDMCQPLHFMHNNGDGTFSDRTKQAGLANQLGGLNIIRADYNNDGCMDLLVLRGGWELEQRMSLLRNNCDGTFTDVTEAAGLAERIVPSQTAVFADIDNDGYLDLFVGAENAPSQLFRNRGDGTFEDISHAAGIDKTAFTKGVAAADYDNDGFVDFYVSNVTGANFLYHNNRNGTFTEVARQAGVQAPYFSFATWFFDYDNDGWPDLFVNCYYSSMEEVLKSYLGLPISTETVKLYRNNHDGTFEDVTAKVGLDKVFMPMGANFGDVDNDGYLDLYLGAGQPSLAALMPHVLLRNDAGKSFSDITESSGSGDIHKGHGVAFADLERSGHEDILASFGGAVPSDKHSMRVFENPRNDNDWINVRLTGAKSNRAAIGARIHVTVENDGGAARSIYRTVGDTSSFGGNPVEQHIGLGHGARITTLDVWWPATNSRQHFANVDKDEYIAIQEFSDKYTKLERPPYRLGGEAAK